MLSGSLGLISFSGLLQLLGAEKRTGKLAVKPEDQGDRPSGALWLAEGELIHAQCDHDEDIAPGEPAALALVTANDGLFEFEPLRRTELPERSIQKSTEQVLLEAACHLDDEERERESELADSAVPRFAPVVAGAGTPRFNTVQWRILSAIDGNRTLAELALAVELPVEAVSELITELVAAQVVELA